MLTDEELDQFLSTHPEAGEEFRRLLRSYRPKSRSGRKRLRDETGPRSEEHVTIPVEFTLPPLPDSYTDIQPGSNMWMRYWRMHPEQQEDMIAFMRKGDTL